MDTFLFQIFLLMGSLIADVSELIQVRNKGEEKTNEKEIKEKSKRNRNEENKDDKAKRDKKEIEKFHN